MLDQYQARWHRYDIALGEIARIIGKKYPAFTAIDIGANIGDTAALINKYEPVPVLCIEGNPGFLGPLKSNAPRIGRHIDIEESFIGSDGSFVQLAQIDEKNGTASLTGTQRTGTQGISVPMKSLETIISAHPEFADTRLIKLDTDGLDFQILLESIKPIQRIKPILYFEYDTKFSGNGEADALQAVNKLFSIGYKKFLVYDNYGNYLITASEPERFAELNAYLRSNKKHGWAVYYFDICAFTDNDADLFEAIHAFEMSV